MNEHDPSRLHFHSLDPQQQAEAIQRLAAAGMGDHTIAHATGLSAEMVRRLLAGKREETSRGEAA